MEPIHFLSEDIEFDLYNHLAIAEWISSVVTDHDKRIGEFTFIFCSDDYLLQVNRETLNHDYYTDIITFPLHVEGAVELVSEIFISVDRVKENAVEFKVSFEDELHRVIIHGVLHLLGYDDKSELLKKTMRSMEDQCLVARSWL